ncbi:MAG TPA: hypothetical protein VGL61_03125 [Kofleriaceae bacterium]
MSKDRAAPFSRKHRRYWIPVTGGMILIGLVNLGLGLASYHAPKEPTRIDVGVGATDPDLIAPGALPVSVVRAFVARYPHTIARGATKSGDNFVIELPLGSPHSHATFTSAGAFVSEDGDGLH